MSLCLSILSPLENLANKKKRRKKTTPNPEILQVINKIRVHAWHRVGWQPAFFLEVQRKILGIVQLQSRFAWGFIFVTGVLPPTLALVYDYVEHNLSGEGSVEDWPLLFWRKKVGFFHHGGTTDVWS